MIREAMIVAAPWWAIVAGLFCMWLELRRVLKTGLAITLYVILFLGYIVIMFNVL